MKTGITAEQLAAFLDWSEQTSKRRAAGHAPGAGRQDGQGHHDAQARSG